MHIHRTSHMHRMASLLHPLRSLQIGQVKSAGISTPLLTDLRDTSDSSISHIGLSLFFVSYAFFSISIPINNPVGVIFAPGVPSGTGVRKLLGIPVVLLMSGPQDFPPIGQSPRQ